jgi:hypothetical protein
MWLLLRIALVVAFCVPAYGWFPDQVSVPVSPGLEQPARADFDRDVVPFLRTHCLDCHSGETPEDELDLEPFLDERVARGESAEWREIRKLVQTHKMPPGSRARPPRQQRKMMMKWVDQAFGPPRTSTGEGGSEMAPLPQAVLRRLNHTEYRNTVRDLVGVDFDAPRFFPTENVGFGFDNIGAALAMPDALFEKYMDAAEQISELAVVTDALNPTRVQAFDGTTMEGNANGDYIWLYTNGDAAAKWRAPRPGRYRMKVEAWGMQAGPDPCCMVMLVDGRKLKQVDVPQRRGENGVFEVEFKIERGRYSEGVGMHKATARFVNDFYNPDAEEKSQRDRNLAVTSIEIHGPLNARPPTEFQQRMMERFASLDVKSGSTKDAKSDAAGAATGNGEATVHRANNKQLLQMTAHLASHFWRRPAEKAEVKRLAKLLNDKQPAELNLQWLLQALLVSPQFLYRAEGEGECGSFELATRLSYFLWSTMPDEELFQLCRDDELLDDEVLQQQVTRMLADPRADALAQNFAAQWLRLRLLDEVAIDKDLYPMITPAMRESMRQETLHFFRAMLQDDLPIRDMINADYSYLDAALAKHYGLPFDGKRVDGGFVRTDLSSTERRGLLAHAGVLMLTSNPTRTSPVKRGKWVMESLLGTVPPPPPADAGGLDETKVDSAASLRVQFEQHRSKPECATCHVVMDPIGFGLERFDAVGRIREGEEIDDLGVLPDGREFHGPAELSQMLHQDFSIIENALEQLYVYAQGRGLSDVDYAVLDQILDSLPPSAFGSGHSDPVNATWRDLATGIVLSDAFRN